MPPTGKNALFGTGVNDLFLLGFTLQQVLEFSNPFCQLRQNQSGFQEVSVAHRLISSSRGSDSSGEGAFFLPPVSSNGFKIKPRRPDPEKLVNRRHKLRDRIQSETNHCNSVPWSRFPSFSSSPSTRWEASAARLWSYPPDRRSLECSSRLDSRTLLPTSDFSSGFQAISVSEWGNREIRLWSNYHKPSSESQYRSHTCFFDNELRIPSQPGMISDHWRNSEGAEPILQSFGHFRSSHCRSLHGLTGNNYGRLSRMVIAFRILANRKQNENGKSRKTEGENRKTLGYAVTRAIWNETDFAWVLQSRCEVWQHSAPSRWLVPEANWVLRFEIR